MAISAQLLKEVQREKRSGFRDALGLRVHRAISWLQKAEQCKDHDSQYIFLWIAFNSAYANELGETRMAESKIYSHFIGRIVELDNTQSVFELVWQKYAGAIRVLLENKYVFQPYWDCANGKESAQNWNEQFKGAREAAHRALARKDTAKVLDIIFNRLYTLRNQLIHGGATWNSQVNRDQLRDACQIMTDLMPIIIQVMMDHPKSHWGEAIYPVMD